MLPDLFKRLREADPSGLYVLKMSPVSYPLPDGHVTGVSNMFQYYIIIHSAAISFWNHSRRVGSMDGAHMTARFGGVVLSFNVKDANNTIVPLAIVPFFFPSPFCILVI